MSNHIDELEDLASWDVPETTEDELESRLDCPIYTLDFETDPFTYEEVPEAFAGGLYDGTTYKQTWGKNAVAEMHEIIKTLPPGIIYAHNGGRFDFYLTLDWLKNQPLLIINSRIVKAYCKAAEKRHQLRDSYAIMPFPLAKYKKLEIEYEKLHRNVREKHREEITTYLKMDCVALWELCTEFRKTFGNKLTIGSAAMEQLKKHHIFEPLGKSFDSDIRSNYYYGGRVECFAAGEQKGNWKVYDVNSMYPYVMMNYKHPVDTMEMETKKIRASTCFITAEGKNYGAFPRKTPNGLRFDCPDGIFTVSIHEWETAIRCGLFEPKRIIRCINFRGRDTFSKFVNHYYELRKKANDSGDDIHSIFYKYILNSAYGKFAQNPENHFEYRITPTDTLMNDDWEPVLKRGMYFVWRKPVKTFSKYNVATGASITGAARSVLMEAIANAKRPLYCDTDSLICEDIPGVEMDASKLGAWKMEATAHTAYIGGKKLYALFGDSCPKCDRAIENPGVGDKKCRNSFHKTGCVKMASKGVKVEPDDVRQVAMGNTIEYFQAAPSFKMDGSAKFIHRKIKRTV